MGGKSNLAGLVTLAMAAGRQASEAILEVYSSDFSYEDKTDGSPITLADRHSDAILTEALSATGIPVISKETQVEEYALRKNWEFYWLVDPLDGTREFISRNGEFAINIALMCGRRPVMGIILAPVKDEAWWGIAEQGAYKLEGLSQHPVISEKKLLGRSVLLKPFAAEKEIIISVSRSHLEEKTLSLAAQIRAKIGPVKLVKKGSALKFCDLLEGRSDLYFRYSACREWDTAAGHALLLAHGGALLHITKHTPLEYNKKTLESPGFIAFSRETDSIRYLSELSF